MPINILEDYHKVALPSDKVLLEEYNQAAFQEFKTSKVDKATLQLFPVSLIPNVVVTQPVEFSKENDKNAGNCQIDFIYKDKEYQSFVWRASPQKLQLALRYGILDAETLSVTSRVINCLGQYRLSTLERFQEGIISNRYQLKEQFLTHYQDRVQALQELESLANQYAVLPDEKTVAKHAGVINHYIQSLKNILVKIEMDFSEEKIHCHLNQVDQNGILHLQDEIKADIARAEEFSKQYRNNIKVANQATGTQSILTYVKQQIARDLRRLQNHNQNMTYSLAASFALTRGDLNSVIEDAEKIIEDYKAPQHDSAYQDHHGSYTAVGNEVVYDSSFHCHSKDQEKRALLAISFIEELNSIQTVKEKNQYNYKLKGEGGEPFVLNQLRATKWGLSGGWWRGIKRFFAFSTNIILKLVMGVIELPATLILEPLFVKLPLFLLRGKLANSKLFTYAAQFFKSLRFAATFEITVKNKQLPKLAGKHWLKVVERRQDTLGLRVRQLAENAFKNTVLDLFYGVRDIYKQFTVRLFDSVINDYKINNKTNVQESLNVAQKELDSLIAANHKDLDVLLSKLYADKKHLSILDKLYPLEKDTPLKRQLLRRNEVASAIPASKLGSGEYDDLFASASEGFEQFLSFFLHNIHAKHPAAGLIFTSTYLLAAAAVLYPQIAAKFLSSGFVEYSRSLGFGMSKSPITAAISSGCTQAQMTSSAYEFLLDGPQSWIASNAAEFEKDPFTSLVYGATAIGLGYLLVYQCDVPGLSEALRDDMGTFPSSSLAFMGAKLGFVVYELLKEHAGAQSLDLDHCILLSNDFLVRMSKNEKFKEHIEKVRLLQFLFLNKKNLALLSPNMKHVLAQHIDQSFPTNIAKSLKTTLYPEERTSILRTTLGIIFSYPAYVARVFVALFTSLKAHSLHPLQRAADAFGEKILKDITRVLRASGNFFKAGVMFLRRHLKVLADVILNSGFARMEAVLNNTHHVANSTYKVSAELDANFEKVRQFVGTPVDALVKKVTTADPIDTQRKTFDFYGRMFQEVSLPRLSMMRSERLSTAQAAINCK